MAALDAIEGWPVSAAAAAVRTSDSFALVRAPMARATATAMAAEASL